MDNLRRYPAIAGASATSLAALAVISAMLAAGGAAPWPWAFLAAAIVLTVGAGAALAVALATGKVASAGTKGPQR